jgi:hypothetical protein
MTDLDQLGRRHRKLMADLADLRDELAHAIRDERARGATVIDLLQRSGYTSAETIRRIVRPETRERANQIRRAP